MEGQFLRVTGGNAAGSEIPLDEGLLIGRSVGGDGGLGGDPELSREHANIKWAGVQLLIEDLGSTNGTFVNGERITEATPIRPGDAISIGASTLEVAGTVPAAPDPTLATAPPIQPTRIAPAPEAEAGPPSGAAPPGPPPDVAGPPPGVTGPARPGVTGPPPGFEGPAAGFRRTPAGFRRAAARNEDAAGHRRPHTEDGDPGRPRGLCRRVRDRRGDIQPAVGRARPFNPRIPSVTVGRQWQPKSQTQRFRRKSSTTSATRRP